MKYKEVPEPHRSLLFRLVEIDEGRPTPTGLIPVREMLGGGLALWEGEPGMRFVPDYALDNLRVLEKDGYITYLTSPGCDPKISLTSDAIDYHKYMHSFALWRFIIDVWDKTEKYWLALLFGLIGGAVPGLIRWLGSLLR